MIHETSPTAVAVFALFVAAVLWISFRLGARARSAGGYFAAHGRIHWFVNGVAFAGDYLSAASSLGICGMIAFYGYDGFLYSIGFLAGWVVALFVVAEPLKRMGRYTFADALDRRFRSRGIKLAAAASTLVVSVFYLIPQMVGAGALIRPMLGFSHQTGVLVVGVVVIVIVVTAGMLSTTYVQFIKGGMLVVFCAILAGMILLRGFAVEPGSGGWTFHPVRFASPAEAVPDAGGILPETGGWQGKPYIRVEDPGSGAVSVWRKLDPAGELLAEAQVLTVGPDGKRLVNGRPQGRGEGQAFKDVYGLPPERALVPFSQPGIVTIPLGFAVLVAVSLLTRPRGGARLAETT